MHSLEIAEGSRSVACSNRPISQVRKRLAYLGLGVTMSMLALTRTAAQSARANALEIVELQLNVSEFHAAWQQAWRESEEYRRWRVSAEDYARRHLVLHCHKESFDEGFRRRWNLKGPHLESYQIAIDPAVSGHRWCPRWLVNAKPDDAGDESAWVDLALRPSLRAGIAKRRTALIAALDSAYRLQEKDPWLAGQAIRFRIEALDTLGAMEAVARCRAEAWWCAALRGMVHARVGNPVVADSSFKFMRTLMSDSLRCEWDNVAELLPSRDGVSFSAVGCSEQETLAERFWWLADPLFREPGNARRTEHDARQTEIRLRTATIQDERLTFESGRGGESVARMIRRYGWPTYRSWLGVAEDRSHVGYVTGELRGVAAPPYTTFEYALDRISTVPSWRAVLNPYAATTGDWHLSDEAKSGTPSPTWWPREHFRAARRMVELPEGQTVTVRRQTFVEVVSAFVLSHPSMQLRGDRYDVMLLGSDSPTVLDSLDQQIGGVGDTLRLRGRLAGKPTLLAIEATSLAPEGVDARLRFGLTPATPLSTLDAAEPALSDIAILSPFEAGALIVPSDSLLAKLRPSRVLSASDRRISLYWESYNTEPSDSAQTVLRVVPVESAGLLRRLGVAARLLSDPSEGVEVRWRDYEPVGGQSTLNGPVPAQVRVISLDLSNLKAGRYLIDVRMERRDGRTAVQQTTVELSP